VRTWAKRGQTPVLDFNFNYETLSAVAGMTFWNFYFQLFPKSIRSPQVIEFLSHLKRYLRRPLLLIWDRLPAHKSQMTQQLGLLEATRTAQRLPSGLLGAGRSRAPDVEAHPASSAHSRCRPAGSNRA
jgi:hypothetical protein